MNIRKIAFALPANEVASQTVADWSGLKQDFIEQKIGIASRRFLTREERPLDLAAAACQNLFDMAGGPSRDAIQLIVVVTQNPDFGIPHSAALLQHKLGLDTGTAAFDIGLGCSGYVYALSIVRSIMHCEGIANALLVTCDPYSRIMGSSDRDTIALFGDAATATWLSADEGATIGKLDFGTDGAGAEHLIVPAGGSARPTSALYEPEAATLPPARDFRLHMNGRGIFNFMMERIPTSVANALEKNQRQLSDIDLFVFHQGSRFLLDQLVARLSLPPERVPSNIAHHGNTVSSSIPLLLAQLQDDDQLRNKTVLVSGFGVGLSWATTVLQF